MSSHFLVGVVVGVVGVFAYKKFSAKKASG